MLLGYNTNGLADHDLPSALRLLAEAGYGSVAITLDRGRLDPYAADYDRALAEARALLDGYGLRSTIETGARFLLDPRVKHEPTLLSADVAGRGRRVDFYRRAIDAAAQLGSDSVSLWSGALRDDPGEEAAWERLVGGLGEVLDYAGERGVAIGFEPEPGMFVDTMDRYAELQERSAAPQLKLTLDVGHLHCLGELPIADQVRRWGDQLVNVHIEDMLAGVHEHLMFGEGEIDFPPVIAALREVGYAGGLHVELSRHSHVGPRAVQEAIDFLRPLVEPAPA